MGTQNGTIAKTVIGKAGGSLTSSDGLLKIDIPADALGADTQIEITSLTNMAHGRIGSAYRLAPDGQTFSLPVTLTLTYNNADLAGTAPEALGAAYQTSDGYWKWAGPATVDKNAKTVTISTTHFSDWSMVKGFQIQPPSKTVKTNESAALRVVYCFEPEAVTDTDGDILQPLGYSCDASDMELAPLLPIALVSNWSVNGVAGGNSTIGTVSGSDASATYTAPSSKPNPNTVAVSAEVDMGTKGKTLVVSNITITEDNTYTGSIDFDLAPLGGEYTITGNAQVTWTQFEDLGDVRRYLPSGTITADISMQNCDPLHTTVPIHTSETLVVYTSSNYAFPNHYQFVIVGDGTFTLQCGNPRTPVTMPGSTINIAVGPYGSCAFPQFTVEDILSGGPWSCADVNVQSATWNFLRP